MTDAQLIALYRNVLEMEFIATRGGGFFFPQVSSLEHHIYVTLQTRFGTTRCSELTRQLREEIAAANGSENFYND